MNIGRIDLNLLVYLDVLLRERNVTRAASYLGITQPAMSNGLRRLRELFDDPLLVRTSEGMTPTERALELQPVVRSVLAAVERAVQPKKPFDAARSTRVFRIMARDYAESTLIPAVLERLQRKAPLGAEAPFYVLLEFEHQGADAPDQVMRLFEQCVQAGWVLDGVLSQTLAQARELWLLRESMSETLARWLPYKNDIGLRIPVLRAFIERAQALVEREYRGLEVVWYGHVGDGNLHLNVLKPETMAGADFAALCERVTHGIAALVRDCGGSISAEHGVGLLKKHILHYTRSPAEIEALRQIKRVFDPAAIMNPGKVFDP